MGKFAQDAKNLILGNDGSDKEPDDFKTELYRLYKKGEISKADGTLLITARTNCDKLAELLAKNVEKDVKKASKEDGVAFETKEEAQEYLEEKDKKKKEKEEKKKRQLEMQQQSLEQQIQASKTSVKAKMEAEKNLGKQQEIERNK